MDIGSGLSSFGSNVGSGITNAFQMYEQKKQQDAFNDAMFDYMKDKGVISQQALARYHDMNRQQKNATILEGQFAMKNQAEQEKEAYANRLAAAHANYYIRRQDPSSELPEIKFDPVKGPDGIVPGILSSRKTGQIIYTKPFTDPGSVEIATDPSGNQFYRSSKGDPRMIDPVKAAQSRAFAQAQATPSPTPAAGGDGASGGMNFLQRALVTMGLGKPSAAPAASATPAAAGNAPAPAGGGINPDQQTAVLNQARDAINRGAPRAAVLQRLQQMGIDVSGL